MKNARGAWASAGLLLCLAGAAGCASGTQEKDDGGERPDAGETKTDASARADSSAGADGSSGSDSGGLADTSIPDDVAVSNAPCSLTSTTLCPDQSECCSSGGTIMCGCLPGPGTQGDSCSMTNECAPGFVCTTSVAQPSTSTCHAWCELPSGSCPSGTTCMQVILPSPMAGGVTYGACI